MSKVEIQTYCVAIRRLAREFDGYRILQISDVHLGRGNFAKPLLRAIDGLAVDLVSLTGDLLHSYRYVRYQRPFLDDLAKAIRPRDGFYAVRGNHDAIKLDAEICGSVRWLENESVRLCRGSAVLNLAGVRQKTRETANLPAALAGVAVGSPIILLAHYPSTVYLLNGIIDLVLSGHTHAGQVKIPGLAYMTNDDLPWRNAHGLSTIGQTQLVVSAGVGNSGPLPLRFMTPREVGIVELKSP